MNKFLITSLLALSSCASIIEGSSNNIQVESAPPSQGTICALHNSLGSWQVTTPGGTSVHKSKTDLKVECNNPNNGTSGTKTVESDVAAWTFGNILLGGLIGLGIDAATGDMWKYPDNVTVTMGNAPMLGQTQSMAPVTTKTTTTQTTTYPTGRQ